MWGPLFDQEDGAVEDDVEKKLVTLSLHEGTHEHIQFLTAYGLDSGSTFHISVQDAIEDEDAD